MPHENDRDDQLRLLSPQQLAELEVERRPSQIRPREGETAPRASRGVRKASLSEETTLQEKLPGLTWPE